MCGIIGIISKSPSGFYQKEVQVFEQLLYAGQVRGSHGTGIFYNNKKNKVKVLKGALPSSQFILGDQFAKASKEILQEATFAIGHNRYATKGGVDFKSTHPFREGDITLIHNGTLHSHKELADTEVDSHAICHSINTIGTEKTLELIDGAFALVWHDKRNNSLNLIRNSERPLFAIETTGAYIICSEVDMGLWICKRNNITVQKFYPLEVGNLVVVNLETMVVDTKKMTLYSKKYYGYSNYSSESNDWGTYSTTSKWDSEKKKWYEPTTEPKKDLPIQNGTILNLPSKVLNIKYAGKSKGDVIQFFPTTIKSTGAADYLEGIMESPDLDGVDVEVRFYNPNMNKLEKLLKEDTLVAKIATIATNAAVGKFFIVESPDIAVLSLNNSIITPEDIPALPTVCHCCGGHFSHLEEDIMQSNIVFNKNTNSLDVYCPDCTSWTEELLKSKQGTH